MNTTTTGRAIAALEKKRRARQERWKTTCAQELNNRARREKRAKAVEVYLEICAVLADEMPAGYLRDVYRHNAYWVLRDLRRAIK
jgi:hypothetical protein